jgi:putative ATP-binding cassette transporter
MEVDRCVRLDRAKLDATNARKLRKDQVETLSALIRKLVGGGFLPMWFLQSSEEHHLHANATHSSGHSHDGGLKDHAHEKFSRLAQASEGFDEMLLHLLLVAENLNDLTRFHALAEDLAQAVSFSPSKGNIRLLDLVVPEADTNYYWLSCKDLCIRAPTASSESQLVSNLSFALKRGESMLVAGPSGCGKTALLRVICGLWSWGEGEARRPSREEVLFLPQRSYCPLDCTLRDQVLYPGVVDRPVKDEDIEAALVAVGLDHVRAREKEGIHAWAHSWTDKLSMGEVQRLAFARLVIRKPKYAVLDEATAACDIATEAKLYKLVEQICTGGFLSVGHRPSIEYFHLKKLVLSGVSGQGKWEFEF